MDLHKRNLLRAGNDLRAAQNALLRVLEAAAGETCETAATSKMPGAPTAKMATAAMAAASSTMCERCDGPERHHAGQNQTEK